MDAGALHALIRDTCRRLGETLLKTEPTLTIFLFGSRAAGTASPRSDVDLGIDAGHPLPSELLSHVRDAFEGLPIFQKVDVVDFAEADPAFSRVAKEAVEILYERKAA